ncbi:MAG: hypothetical protein JO249_13135 [Acidobacteria bacterium]|nr:hypothetical protein [Acidobacteriota bacterium]
MKSIHILSVSEAQKLLPKIMQLVAAGEDVVIVNRRNMKKFRVTLYQEALDQKLQPKHGSPSDLQ